MKRKKLQLAGSCKRSGPEDVPAHVFLCSEVAALALGHMIQAPSPKIPFMFTIFSLRSIRLAKHIFHHLLYSFERNGCRRIRGRRTRSRACYTFIPPNCQIAAHCPSGRGNSHTAEAAVGPGLLIMITANYDSQARRWWCRYISPISSS